MRISWIYSSLPVGAVERAILDGFRQRKVAEKIGVHELTIMNKETRAIPEKAGHKAWN